jgi:hypothetical protein
VIDPVGMPPIESIALARIRKFVPQMNAELCAALPGHNSR